MTGELVVLRYGTGSVSIRRADAALIRHFGTCGTFVLFSDAEVDCASHINHTVASHVSQDLTAAAVCRSLRNSASRGE